MSLFHFLRDVIDAAIFLLHPKYNYPHDEYKYPSNN